MPPRPRFIVGCLFLALSALAVGAAPDPADGRLAGPPTAEGQQVGGIRGRLTVPRPARPAERRPEVADPGAGGPRDVPDHRQGVVYLETAPRSAFDERSPTRVIMDQRNERFVPNLLAVMVGTIVDFPNNDRTYHNVFSLSRAKRFDLGRYAAGRSKAVTMDRPGIVRVFCDIHSHMSAYVLVFAHPYFDVASVDGRYEIGNLPPSTYAVVGWYEGQARVTRTIAVAAGTWTDLDMVVPR
jgi:plastocyanin